MKDNNEILETSNNNMDDDNLKIETNDEMIQEQQVCVPGQRECVLGVVHICNSRGTGWVATGEPCE